VVIEFLNDLLLFKWFILLERFGYKIFEAVSEALDLGWELLKRFDSV
jgi:hypothetical protein